jgi:hypothetical protein
LPGGSKQSSPGLAGGGKQGSASLGGVSERPPFTRAASLGARLYHELMLKDQGDRPKFKGNLQKKNFARSHRYPWEEIRDRIAEFHQAKPGDKTATETLKRWTNRLAEAFEPDMKRIRSLGGHRKPEEIERLLGYFRKSHEDFLRTRDAFLADPNPQTREAFEKHANSYLPNMKGLAQHLGNNQAASSSWHLNFVDAPPAPALATNNNGSGGGTLGRPSSLNNINAIGADNNSSSDVAGVRTRAALKRTLDPSSSANNNTPPPAGGGAQTAKRRRVDNLTIDTNLPRQPDAMATPTSWLVGQMTPGRNSTLAASVDLDVMSQHGPARSMSGFDASTRRVLGQLTLAPKAAYDPQPQPETLGLGRDGRVIF